MSTPKSKVITVRVVGPLASYADEFTAWLAERCYTPLTRVNHLQLMTHLSKWMQTQELEIEDLCVSRVEQYLRHRRERGYASFHSWASLDPLRRGLSNAGAPLKRSIPVTDDPAEALLDDYRRYLQQERALATSTTEAYVLRPPVPRWARRWRGFERGRYSSCDRCGVSRG